MSSEVCHHDLVGGDILKEFNIHGSVHRSMTW